MVVPGNRANDLPIESQSRGRPVPSRSSQDIAVCSQPRRNLAMSHTTVQQPDCSSVMPMHPDRLENHRQACTRESVPSGNVEQDDGSVHLEDDSKPRLAAHHTIVGRLSLLKRKYLIRRADAVKLAEGKRVLGIDGDA